MVVATVVEALHPLPRPRAQPDVNPGVVLPDIITMRHHFL